MTDIIKRTMENLEKNHMQAFFAENQDEAKKIALSLIKEGDTIGVGGSVTLNQLNLLTVFRSGDYNFLDRYGDKTAEEIHEIFHKSLSADAYFLSANAVTENGELYNVDGTGNRVAALIYGPKKVIVIVGKNKIVRNIDEAVLRVKSIAAPLNCQRLNKKTPCAAIGKCIAFTDGGALNPTAGCHSKDRICRDYIITGEQVNPDRIKVIIVNEDMGY